jgi:hypothetical protein
MTLLPALTVLTSLAVDADPHRELARQIVARLRVAMLLNTVEAWLHLLDDPDPVVSHLLIEGISRWVNADPSHAKVVATWPNIVLIEFRDFLNFWCFDPSIDLDTCLARCTVSHAFAQILCQKAAPLYPEGGPRGYGCKEGDLHWLVSDIGGLGDYRVIFAADERGRVLIRTDIERVRRHRPLSERSEDATWTIVPFDALAWELLAEQKPWTSNLPPLSKIENKAQIGGQAREGDPVIWGPMSKVRELVRQARELASQGAYREALQKCDEIERKNATFKAWVQIRSPMQSLGWWPPS